MQPGFCKNAVLVYKRNDIGYCSECREVKVPGQSSQQSRRKLECDADSRKVLDEVKARVDAIDTFPEETEKPVITELTNRTEVISVAVYGDADERSLRTLAEQVRDVSIRIYTECAEYARSRGIIIADTKFEFGLDENDQLVVIDEVLTPDSSRFWPAETYAPGSSPESFDKQYVRDYLETLDWDKTAPGPALPEEIINKTSEKYREALVRLTGSDLAV